ncbi:flagellar basal body L-ring protein [Parvularcula sp. ZS-1/3]|uniref:Flagellar basal body L-ring protein n=1 Tax=Parvularcula mediterranea TaxID=2732508 RepID=A0A7Y3W439_9PROT|nr:flagellar basal body L-ring protein FlgH [Parvularcula mediterranea]NNU15380.1 flagellar basal body L-ring protein [Parvularcula mediterranea]
MKALRLSLLIACGCASSIEDVDRRDTRREKPRVSEAASLWNQDPESLFGNRRAREVGDLLTVLVAIDDEAEILNDTIRNRTSERQFEAPAALGLPQWADRALPNGANLDPGVDVSSLERMRGQGQLRRRDRLNLRLAARVTDRLPNGDLVIEGRQMVQVGSDKRRLLISGTVRPEDVSRQNTIQHDRIANADIRYVNGGPITSTGRRGLGNWLLDVIVPF